MYILLLADDVVLLAPSYTALGKIFVFNSFCTDKGLRINVSKTKLLVNKHRLKAENLQVGAEVELGGMHFEIVPEFKYLGLVFYAGGGEKLMISRLLERSRKCFGWLIQFLTVNGWKHPHLCMVLFDVYVRSIISYGSSVWGPRLLVHGTEHALLQPVLAYHRKCTRTLLGLDRCTHSCLLPVLMARPPLRAELLK